MQVSIICTTQSTQTLNVRQMLGALEVGHGIPCGGQKGAFQTLSKYPH